MKYFQICFVIILIFTSLSVSNGLQDEDTPHYREKRAVDAGLDAMLRAIIKNGTPSLNIPTSLDPLFLNQRLDIHLPEIPGILSFNTFILENLTITGLSDFVANDLSVNIFELSLNFDLTFDVHAHADYAKFDLLVGDMIPLYGDGTLDLNVADLRLNGSINIGSTSQVLGDGHTQFWVIIGSIDADIDIGSTTFDLSNFMNLGGTKCDTAFNKMMSHSITNILKVTATSMKQDFFASIVALVNEQLNKERVTISQLLALMNQYIVF